MHFYATKADLIPVLEKIEHEAPLTYVRYGRYRTSAFMKYDSALDIPSLGIAKSESAVSCEAYLVVPKTTQVSVRKIGMFDYAVDQLMNPGSITFNPGGRFTPEVLLPGRVATASTAPESKALLRRFERVLKKDFHRVAAFYVGPEALALHKAGVRLTMAQQSPKEYDLKSAEPIATANVANATWLGSNVGLKMEADDMRQQLAERNRAAGPSGFGLPVREIECFIRDTSPKRRREFAEMMGVSISKKKDSYLITDATGRKVSLVDLHRRTQSDAELQKKTYYSWFSEYR